MFLSYFLSVSTSFIAISTSVMINKFTKHGGLGPPVGMQMSPHFLSSSQPQRRVVEAPAVCCQLSSTAVSVFLILIVIADDLLLI